MPNYVVPSITALPGGQGLTPPPGSLNSVGTWGDPGDLPIVATRYAPLTPRWWCARLYEALMARQPAIRVYDAYYRGDHPLPWLAPQAEDAFRRILAMSRTNYMGLVVDATVERLEVLGFRIGDNPDGDEAAWKIWQANNLDAFIGDAFLEAGKSGTAYLLVAPPTRTFPFPRITVEHPSQVIVEYEPGDMRERAAGLKVWTDSRQGTLMATLYLPDGVYKWQGRPQDKPDRWAPRLVAGETWPAPNPVGVVPIVELANNPQWTFDGEGLRYAGVSEMADVIDIQDRINKTIADRLMTQDFGAFPQRWSTGWDSEEDPDPAANGPRGVDIGRDRLITATDPATRFGQFDPAPLDPYSKAKSEDVKDIASRTRTPSQYLLGEIVNVGPEALTAAESGLVSKIRQRKRSHSEGLEEAIRLGFRMVGDGRADETGAETIWKDESYRSEAVRTDAVIKRHQVGLVPKRQSREDLGYSPQQIARMEEAERQEALEAALAAALAAPPEPPAIEGAAGDVPDAGGADSGPGGTVPR